MIRLLTLSTSRVTYMQGLLPFGAILYSRALLSPFCPSPSADFQVFNANKRHRGLSVPPVHTALRRRPAHSRQRTSRGKKHIGTGGSIDWPFPCQWSQLNSRLPGLQATAAVLMPERDASRAERAGSIGSLGRSSIWRTRKLFSSVN